MRQEQSQPPAQKKHTSSKKLCDHLYLPNNRVGTRAATAISSHAKGGMASHMRSATTMPSMVLAVMKRRAKDEWLEYFMLQI